MAKRVSHIIQVVVSPELADKLEHHARKQKLSVSGLSRRMLESAIKDLEGAEAGQPGLLLRGKRYIVSLRREGSVYRSWADGTQLNIEVHSGSHKQKDLPINSGPSITIAYILLTPGEDANPAEFSSHLGWPPNQYGEPIYIYERLKKLQFHRSRIVRDSACVTAANIFWYRPRCLQDIAERPDSQSQAAAKQFLTDQLMLRERLRVNPFFLAPQPSTEYAFQTLEIFADDMRPDVRKQACTVLREVAPLRTVQSCK